MKRICALIMVICLMVSSFCVTGTFAENAAQGAEIVTNSSSSKLFKALDKLFKLTNADKLLKEFGGVSVREKDVSYGSFLRTSLLSFSVKGYKFVEMKVDYDPVSHTIIRINMLVKQNEIQSEIQKMIDEGAFVPTPEGYVCSPKDAPYKITLSETYDIVLMDKVWYYVLTITY